MSKDLMRERYKYGHKRYVCAECRSIKHLDQFQIYSNGKRALQCHECYRALAVERGKKGAKKSAENAIKRLVSDLKKDHKRAPHISELAATMVHKLGGIEKFTDRWIEHLDHLMHENTSSRTVLDNLRAISTLIKHATDTQESAPDVESLTDEEIASEIRRYIQDFGLKVFDPNAEKAG